jgi:hypothetical protein
MMNKVWTEEEIVFMLCKNDMAVERAILRLYSFQTESERADGSTKVLNGKGFSGADARLGSYYARWLLTNKHLTGKHLQQARSITLKYRGQLLDYANQIGQSIQA